MSRVFDGTVADYLVQGTDVAVLDITGSLSIGAWIKPRITGGTQTILAKGWSGSSDRSWIFFVTATGMIAMAVLQSDDNGNGATSTIPIRFNQWNYVGTRFDTVANTLATVVNGIVTGSVAMTLDLKNSTSKVKIGGRDDGADAFNGKISKVGMWAGALNTAEWAALLRGVPTGQVAKQYLAGDWPLRGGLSTDPDLKNGNSFILTGTKVQSSIDEPFETEEPRQRSSVKTFVLYTATLSATATNSTSLAAIKNAPTLSALATSIPKLIRSPLRTLTVTATAVALKGVLRRTTLTATPVGVSTIKRAPTKVLKATGVAVSIVRSVYPLNLSATAVAIAFRDYISSGVGRFSFLLVQPRFHMTPVRTRWIYKTYNRFIVKVRGY